MFRVPALSIVSLALAAVFGCTLVTCLPSLPAYGWSLTCGVAATAIAVVARRSPVVRHIASVVAFAAWASTHGAWAMASRLAPVLEGTDVQVTGRVTDLPRRRGADVSFLFVPEKVGASAGEMPALHGTLKLAWYRAPGSVRPCERWRLTVRLRRPRGGVNPGGADGERTALQKRIVATGYVRSAPDNARIAGDRCVDGWRDRIATAIDAVVGERDARIVKALAVGDTRGLEASDWDVARATGVSHLIAISGFHVGIAAGAGVLAMRLLYACLPWLGLRVPRQVAQAALGMAIAGGYGMLAGFGLPTVRTLLMIGVVVLAAIARRQAGGLPLLALAMVVVLAVDPLCVLSAGFWLSFGGVAFLILCASTHTIGWRGWLGALLRAQAAMSVALLPMCLWLFGTTSLAGFPANLLAAPLVSFAVVPLTLGGCVLLFPMPWLGAPMLAAAAWLIGWLWRILATLANLPGAQLAVADSGVAPVMLATLGALWLFVPRGVPLRGFGALLFLPLIFPVVESPRSGAFRVWVLDVGQGLAVLVRTRSHTLVYDTGPAYGGGHDAGAGVVLPSITSLGIAPVDTLVVSHGDSDHAGGASAVASRYPAARRLSGEPWRMPFDAGTCDADAGWSWDGVTFRFIDVPPGAGKTPSNDRSCVLSVEGEGGRFLLTGDIGAKAERRMDVAALASGLPTVTTVAHHGSRHASSAPWLDAVRPELSIVSAGWRNRFGHPHPSVLARHRDVGTAVLDTASSGAIRIDVRPEDGPRVVREWRRPARRYWRE